MSIFDGYLVGKFIIAGPAMRDKRFHNAVIYMCAHDDDQAMGIIINKPKPDLHLSTMLPHLEVKGDITHEDTQVLYGGPVETERGFILHTREVMDDKNSLPLGDDLAMSTSKTILKSLTEKKAPKQAILALGYSGWFAGQLEAEIAQNAWFVSAADHNLIFGDNHADKWESAMNKAGISPAFLSDQIGHA